MKSDGPLDNAIEVLSKRKKNQEKLGSSLNLTLGRVCLDALVNDLRSLDQGDRKNQVLRSSGLGICPGMGYLGDIVKDIRVPNQVQKREDTGQGKRGSTDSQTGFVHSRASGHPHTKGL